MLCIISLNTDYTAVVRVQHDLCRILLKYWGPGIAVPNPNTDLLKLLFYL